MADQSVFISYSRSDSGYVQKLVAFLRENGVPAWADNAINHGEHWEDVICAQIDTCAVFVPVMTPDAWASPWVRNEVARARSRDKPILPLLLAGDFFFGLSHLEAELVTDGQMPRPGYVDRLRTLVGAAAGPLAPLPTEGRPMAHPARPGRRRPGWLVPAAIGLAVVLIMGTVAAVVGRRDGTPDASPSPTPTSATTPATSAATTGAVAPPGSERLESPRTIGPLTLDYTSPSPGGAGASFGYQIHDKTGSVYLLYHDPEKVTRQVVVLAVTGTVTDYENVVDAYLVGVVKDSVTDVSPGRLSGVARCGVLADSGGAFFACAWADPGSIGVVYFYYWSKEECAALFPQVRDAILTRP